MRLFPSLALPPRWRACCHAQALYVKTHLRAFYAGPQPFTVKLVAPEARDALARDARARQDISKISVPRLLADRSDSSHPYLCEELVFGRRPNPAQDANGMVACVLGDLWDQYHANGFEWHTCAKSHDMGALLSNFEEMIDAFAWPDKEDLRGRLSCLYDESSKLVPWCLGHGDIAPSNLLVSGNRIVLLDWEKVGRLPLFLELAKIIVSFPGTWAPIAARVREEFRDVAPPGMASPEAMGALASLERLAALRARFSAASPDAAASWSEARRFKRRLIAEFSHLTKVMDSYSH